LASAHGEPGAALIFFGRPKEGLDFVQKSIRLNSREPNMVTGLLHIAMGVFFREYEAAVEAAKQVIRAHPDFPNNYRWLAAALGQLGPAEEEREALGRPSSLHLPISTNLSAGGCRGCGRKTTPTWSKACARPAGRVDAAAPDSPTIQLNRY